MDLWATTYNWWRGPPCTNVPLLFSSEKKRWSLPSSPLEIFQAQTRFEESPPLKRPARKMVFHCSTILGEEFLVNQFLVTIFFGEYFWVTNSWWTFLVEQFCFFPHFFEFFFPSFNLEVSLWRKKTTTISSLLASIKKVDHLKIHQIYLQISDIEDKGFFDPGIWWICVDFWCINL